jgi:murein DD-endopeptidase MepM/ murein hydrolase activator NlpD
VDRRTVLALTLTFSAAAAQVANLDLPAAVRQGDTIRITALPEAVSARMAGRTVRLFSSDGQAVGLMPVEVNQAPGSYDLEVVSSSGAVLQKKTIAVEHVDFPTQNIVISRAKKALKPSPGELRTVAALRDSVTPERLWVEPFTKPTGDCENSPFGVRRLHNGSPTGSYHRGLDQRSRKGTPVRAITGGTVRIVRMYNLHGGTVGIDHGQGVTSFYLHLSRFRAKEGARVKRGEVIGYVGSTGFANGPHLHWQLTVNGVPVNPHQWVQGIDVCPEPPPPPKPATRKNRRRKAR